MKKNKKQELGLVVKTFNRNNINETFGIEVGLSTNFT